MLLFSTLLAMNDTLTEDAFIRLVLEWNQSSVYEENIVQGIDWHGERNVRYGTDALWLAFQEYPAQQIIAVRHEKRRMDGSVWDTDFVMNFRERKLSVQLERSYLEEALAMDPAFSTPHFITLLIGHGCLRDDGGLPVLREPIFLTKDELQSMADDACGGKRYRLPVVCVSRTGAGWEPVDVRSLAGRLKGVAHVLAEESPAPEPESPQLCGEELHESGGTVSVYFPNAAYGHKAFSYHAADGYDSGQMERVIRCVISYCNAQMMERLYTWQGVSSALLIESLNQRGAELLAAEFEKARMAAETDELLESADDDIQTLRRQIGELTRANEALAYEIQGLRAKLNGSGQIPVLYSGEEEEYFCGEIRDMLLEAVQSALPQYADRPRRKDILEDIIRSNACGHGAADRAEQLKTLLKGYKDMSGSMKRTLQDMGFTITGDGKHYKLLYHGDSRYQFTMAKTPGSGRTGINTAMEIIKDIF